MSEQPMNKARRENNKDNRSNLPRSSWAMIPADVCWTACWT